MLSPDKRWEEAPLRKLAEVSLEKPGMYLIALRAHLNKGKTFIGDVVNTVAEVFPKSVGAQTQDEV